MHISFSSRETLPTKLIPGKFATPRTDTTIMKTFYIASILMFISLYAIPAGASVVTRQNTNCTNEDKQSYDTASSAFSACQSSIACNSSQTYCQCCSGSSNSCCDHFYTAASIYSRCGGPTTNTKFLNPKFGITINFNRDFLCYKSSTSSSATSYVSAVMVGLMLAVAVPIQSILWAAGTLNNKTFYGSEHICYIILCYNIVHVIFVTIVS